MHKDGVAIGQFTALKHHRMSFKGYEGGVTCDQEVLLVCDSTYRLLTAEGHHCHLSLTFGNPPSLQCVHVSHFLRTTGTPIACSEEAVTLVETQVNK